MTITSVGYERAISYAELGTMLAHAGAQYSVFGVDALSAAAGVATREVVLQPGRAYGQGILDDCADPISLVGSAVSSGNRWDLIALRRNWVSGETVPVLIPGTSAKALPARETSPGDEDDQPLWLARFAAGQTAVQELVDLRVWHGDGGAAAKDLLVRDYLTRIGTRVWIQGITWVLGFNSSGTPTWVPDSVYVGTTAPPYADNLSWIKVP